MIVKTLIQYTFLTFKNVLGEGFKLFSKAIGPLVVFWLIAFLFYIFCILINYFLNIQYTELYIIQIIIGSYLFLCFLFGNYFYLTSIIKDKPARLSLFLNGIVFGFQLTKHISWKGLRSNFEKYKTVVTGNKLFFGFLPIILYLINLLGIMFFFVGVFFTFSYSLCVVYIVIETFFLEKKNNLD